MSVEVLMMSTLVATGTNNKRRRRLNYEGRSDQDEILDAPDVPPTHEARPPPSMVEQDLIRKRPEAPALVYNENGQTYGMPCLRVIVNSEFNIGTAFSNIDLTFVNTSDQPQSGLLVLPTRGTVTSVNVQIGYDRYLGTTFIDNDEVGDICEDDTAEENPLSVYIPDLFRLPISDIQPGEQVFISLSVMETLMFVDGRYHFIMPLRFGPGILPRAPLENIIHISASINSTIPGIRYGSNTHELILTGYENLRTKLYAHSRTGQSEIFHLAYYAKCSQITPSLLIEPPAPESYDQRGSFVCFINPPSSTPDGIAFPRDVIFLLDRSGSMGGRPHADACKGLEFALQSLGPRDRFGIVSFDHEQVYFDPNWNYPPVEEVEYGRGYTWGPMESPNRPLRKKSDRNIQIALDWVRRNQPRGGTDILTPLSWALDFLNVGRRDTSRLPFVVLLTDGAVENEREIVDAVENAAGDVRILTFGIGTYCNWYFLKMVANMSRGWNDGSVMPDDLFPKITSLMERASGPILTNVSIQEFEGGYYNNKIELYPRTVPDLFVGGPIIIAGKFSGSFPQQLTVRGTTLSGEVIEMPLTPDVSEIVPVSRVFLKQRLDDLTAEHWRTGNSSVKDDIVQTSVNEQFPSPYTSMVAYELTPEQKREMDRDKEDREEKETEEEKSPSKKPRRGPTAGQIAALGVGAVVVGAAVFALGDPAATSAGLSAFAAAAGDLFGGGNVPDCCGLGIDCGGCGDCIDCGDCGGCEMPDCGCEMPDCGCGDICGDICGGCELPDCPDCSDCSGLFSGICECFGDLADGVEGCFESVMALVNAII